MPVTSSCRINVGVCRNTLWWHKHACPSRRSLSAGLVAPIDVVGDAAAVSIRCT